MKTIYQKPETKIIKIQIQHLMNVSYGEGSIVNSVGISDADYSGQETLSRGGSLWDDEE